MLVTRRMRPLRMGKGGRRWSTRSGCPTTGASKGLVTRRRARTSWSAFVADPNVSIQETKALTGTIEPGRRSRMRRIATTPAWYPDVVEDGAPRDLPEVGHRPEGTHGMEGPQQKESEQA